MKKLFEFKQVLGLLFVFAIFGIIGYLYSQNAVLKTEYEKLKKEKASLTQDSSLIIQPKTIRFFDKGYNNFNTQDECEEEVERLKRELSRIESDNLFESSRSLNNSMDLSQCESEKRRLESQVSELEYEVSRLKSQLR